MEKVSVIVPVYNVEEYLEECLNSIVNQSFKNLEIIVVNDGSTDNSYNIIRNFSEKYKNIKVINQENSGLSEARNSGIKVATGKYIMFVDSDDFLNLDMIEKMYDKAEENKCSLIICDLMLYWSKYKQKVYNNIKEDEKKRYTSKELYEIFLSNKMNCQVMNKLYRKDIWEINNLFFEKGAYYEDIIPTFKVLDFYKEAMFINEPLYMYRMREGSITHSASNKKVFDLVNAINKAKEYAKFNSGINHNDFIKYEMSFDVNYGLYVKSLIKNLEDEDFKINVNKDLNLNYSIFEVLLNKNITLKTKLKFFIWKLKRS